MAVLGVEYESAEDQNRVNRNSFHVDESATEVDESTTLVDESARRSKSQKKTIFKKNFKTKTEDLKKSSRPLEDFGFPRPTPRNRFRNGSNSPRHLGDVLSEVSSELKNMSRND